MRSFLFLITLLPNLLAAEPTLRVSPALSLSFSTEKGSLHQLHGPSPSSASTSKPCSVGRTTAVDGRPGRKRSMCLAAR